MSRLFSKAACAAVLPCFLMAGCNTMDLSSANAGSSVDVSAPAEATDAPAAPAATARKATRAAAPREVAASSDLKAIVRRHAEANGVPFPLANAVVMVESRYRPQAANAGNFGLMQIRLQTARGVGYQGDASGLLNPDTNARFAMKYLAQAYRLAGGDTCRTIMKYQSGHMAIRMSGANRAYCGKVRTLMAQA